MKIELNDLWDDLDFDETLSEYVKRNVDEQIKEITSKIDRTISSKIAVSLTLMTQELESSKAFAKCADTKINKHLIEHTVNLRERD